MIAEFRRRRDIVVGRFRSELPGVEFVDPLGAFYFFFRVDSFGGSAGRSSARGSLPPTRRGAGTGRGLRGRPLGAAVLCAATESIVKALDRIVAFAKKLGD